MKVPQKVGKYELLRQIGRGSTGMIYESQDPSSGEKVAIKIAIPSKAKKSGDVSQGNKILLREANTAKHLDHPNILKMLSADMDEGVFYIVMELVEGGKTLKRYCLEKNLLPYHVVMDIIYKCAKALDYAHRCGIIHRDIKPGNILLTKDMDVRIADFSIASIMHTEEDAQSLGEFLGSPRYMSPEQIQGDKLTIQSDLFSLGIVMFEMITGQHPFYAKRFSLLVHKIINSQQPLLREYRKDVPVVLERIVHHALAKNVKKRYQQGLNMAADLNLAYECAVPAKENAPAVPAKENAHAVPAKENVPAVPAKENAHAAPAKENAHAAPAKENAHAVPAKENAHAAPAKENVHAAPAKENAHAAPAKENAPAVPTKENTPAAPAEENAHAAPAEENAHAVLAKENTPAAPTAPTEENAHAVPAEENGHNPQKDFDSIKEIGFFRDFSEQQLSEVRSLCRWEQYASGERVIAAGGDWQKSLCIIAAGEAQISLRDNVIQTLGKGQCFGEMVLYSNDPPNFSVAAINNVRAFCIGKESFDSLSMECIQAFYCGIARALDERLSAVMRLYEVNPN